MLELQVLGAISSVEAFELRLRAAGASEGVRFRNIEAVLKIPPQSSGAINGKVRLIKTGGGGEEDFWEMIQEHEVERDGKGLCKIVEVDSCEIRGEDSVFKQLGFVPEFQIGRVGKRVLLGEVEEAWEIEYFLLFDPKSLPPTTRGNGNSQQAEQKLACYVAEANNSSPSYLVTVRRRFSEGRETQAILTQFTKLLRRLQPEFQPIPHANVDAAVVAAQTRAVLLMATQQQ